MSSTPLPLVALTLAALTAAQSVTTETMRELTGFLPKTITVDGTDRRYVVYVPPGYHREREWPLIVFLNGMGECGTDGNKQLEVGLGPAIRADADRWPFVVVFPQKPTAKSQWVEHEAMVMAMLAATEKEYRIAAPRRFLTGVSQGGAGTWALGMKHRDVWAAIAPVCGYGDPATVGFRDMPVWAFHGLADKTVPAQQSKDLCAAVEAARGSPVLTLYEGIGHNSWVQAYRDSNLAEWLRVLPSDSVLGQVLAAPESLLGIGLYLESAVSTGRPGEQDLETVSIYLDGVAWGLRLERHREVRNDASFDRVPVGEPIVRELSPRTAAKGIAECVRRLVRGGVAETDRHLPWPPEQEGGYVRVDYRHGEGGRSVSSWPKTWRVGGEPDPTVDASVEAVRSALEYLKKIR